MSQGGCQFAAFLAGWPASRASVTIPIDAISKYFHLVLKDFGPSDVLASDTNTNMVHDDYSTLTFQQLRNELGGVIKRIHADDARGLPVDALVMEAGSIMTALHQVMEQCKGTPLYNAY